MSCVALVALDVALVLRNRELSVRLEEVMGLVRASESSRVVAPLAGSAFPGGVLRRTDGDEVRLDGLARGGGTLLFVSSPACDYCEEARPVWETTRRLVEGTPLRVFGLVLEADPNAIEPAAYDYAVLTPDDRGARLFEHLLGVPATLLVDAAGIVREVVYGSDASALEEVVEAFLLGGSDADVNG